MTSGTSVVIRSTACLRRARDRRRAGFTLIELLVVIGLIIVLVGASAMALKGRGGEGAALANAQSVLVGLVGATRAQAALHQTTARLVIYAQQPPLPNALDAEKYLRALQVLRQEPLANGTTVWVAVGDPVRLPAPVCVVPPAPVPNTHLNTGVTWSTNAATGPVSILAVATGFNYRGQSAATVNQFFGAQGSSGRIYYLDFASDGTVISNTTPNPTKIAIATAVLGSNVVPKFTSANSVRGLFIRKSGAISPVNDATGF